MLVGNKVKSSKSTSFTGIITKTWEAVVCDKPTILFAVKWEQNLGSIPCPFYDENTGEGGYTCYDLEVR